MNQVICKYFSYHDLISTQYYIPTPHNSTPPGKERELEKKKTEATKCPYNINITFIFQWLCVININDHYILLDGRELSDGPNASLLALLYDWRRCVVFLPSPNWFILVAELSHCGTIFWHLCKGNMRHY